MATVAATTMPPDDLAQTDRSRLRRKRDRGTFDRAVAEAVHRRGPGRPRGHRPPTAGPIVLPMAHARIDDRLYVHGSPANHLLRTLADGAPACVTVTMLDGLVLARSAFHHSMDYRCVVLFGSMETVTRPGREAGGHGGAGRAPRARPRRRAPAPPTDAELDATLFLRLAIREGSVKVRRGGPVDDEADLDSPVWAGHVPLVTGFGAPVPDPAGEPARARPRGGARPSRRSTGLAVQRGADRLRGGDVELLVQLHVGRPVGADQHEVHPAGGERGPDRDLDRLVVEGLEHGQAVGDGQGGEVDAVGGAEELLEARR